MAVINAFHGIVPRLAWHRLPREAATVAHDVKLRNGKLEAWRERLAVTQSVSGAVCLHAHGCCLFTYDTCVDMTDYVADYGRVYLTGRKDYPEVAAVDSSTCALTYYRLGVPQPTTALKVSATQSTGRNCAERTYVYTFMNLFGEEGAPSPASSAVTVADGATVTVSGFTTPDAVYGVTHINLYRTATVWRAGNEKSQEPGTEYFLVATFAIGPTSYKDTILDKALGAAITTEDSREPPEDLRHISYLHGTGVLTGVTNNQVHFSRPYLPSDWPAQNDLTLPHNIVNAVTVGNVLFVSTDSYPYVIQGAPNCEAHQCRNVNEVNTPLPDISCGHAHSAIGTPFGMIYSSKDGLVLVSGDGKFQLVTSGWFSSDDWVKIRPDTVRLAYWRGYVVCVTDAIAFMLEIDAGTYNDETGANLVTISDSPVDLITDDAGELLMLQDDIIWQWNAGKTYRKYQWISRELGENGESTPLAAKVRTTGIKLQIIDAEGGHLFERFVPDETPVRLARLGRRVPWRLGFTGTGTVEYAALGMTMNTVRGDSERGNTM